MDLKVKFENKLRYIETKIIKAKQAILYLQQLLSKLKRLVKESKIKQIFIRKEIELNKTKILLSEYIEELSIYCKHKDIILEKSKTIRKALELLDDITDKVTSLISDVQAMIIFLEHSDYNG